MGIKKILILSLTLLSLPLFILINQVDNNDKNPEKIKKIVKNLYLCYDLPREQREKCFLTNLKTNLTMKDNLSLIKEIDKDTVTNKKIKNLCHELTHLIGSTAYIKHQDKTLIAGYDSCGQGYYHGIMNEILLENKNQQSELTKFCAKTTPDSNALGLCYHGIGHTLYNIITTKNDKQYIDNLIQACIKITSTDKINKITTNLAMLCFTGGFEEYLRIKYLDTPNQIEKPSSESCKEVEVNFIKYCYSILINYEIILQFKSTSLSLDTIYQNFSEKCNSLPSETEKEIKIKEGCNVSLAKSYANVVLTGDADNKIITSPKIGDLSTEELYKIITKICSLDYNNNCTLWFLLELNEKLPPEELDSLVAKFEQFSLNDLFSFVF